MRVERQRLVEHLNRPRFPPQRLQLTLRLEGRVRLPSSLDGHLTLILDGREWFEFRSTVDFELIWTWEV